MYSYNKSQRDALISQIYFGKELYMFRPDLLPIIRSLNTVLLNQYCVGGKIEKNEMGWAFGAYGGVERCAQGFGGEA
jgi:hypothetical protein